MNATRHKVSLPLGLLAGVASVLASVPSSAHHGGGIEWNRDVNGPVTGTVTEFAFRFPHVQVYMDVADDEGNVENWALVTRWTPTVLRGWGWDRNSIRAGDRVTVTYATHVREPNMGNMLTLEVNGDPLPLEDPE